MAQWTRNHLPGQGTRWGHGPWDTSPAHTCSTSLVACGWGGGLWQPLATLPAELEAQGWRRETVIPLHAGKVRAAGSAETILKDRQLLEECHLELPLSLAGKN